MEQKALQVGTAVLLLALLLRLFGTWEGGRDEIGRSLLFFSSGRMVTEIRPPETEATEAATEESEPVAQTSPEIAVPVFGESQEALVQVNAAWEVDTLALLEEPLQWDLTGDKPTVLILHTHATESYEKESGYTETSPYRTLDTQYNMVSIGDRVAEILEAGGVTVLHDRTLYDYPSYNDAYINAREAIEETLEENPSICLVLDLHRNAAEDEYGNQKSTSVTINGVSCAKLMLVMGSDKGSVAFPNWETNLALAVKLQAQLEQTWPGLCYPIKMVTYRYNQDLCSGALLVEVGTAGNTHAQAMAAAEYLAQGILALSKGANY